MFRKYFNLRSLLALIAMAIVTGTIFYSDFLAKKIEKEERQKLSQWIEANKFIASSLPNSDITLAVKIQQENNDIPIIATNEKDSIIDSRNLDSSMVNSPKYLLKKLNEFKASHTPIILELSKEPYTADKYYYGDSKLLKQVRYFPIVQLLIIALFIIVTLYAMSVRSKSTQNQVWAGMAKETAHQLGTPISSLQGWIEMLKENNENKDVVDEMNKDVSRLRLISDRFSKIGSTPKMYLQSINEQVENIVGYIKRMSSERVVFKLIAPSEIQAHISAPLFDWVIENLLKNALDAMGGDGMITIKLSAISGHAIIDISDTGKGISKKNMSNVFRPGFTTKKRGWGLGLSLSKRIIEQYHKGQLFIKHSEPNKGTTFRIVLNS
ncbi:MAG: HAMP domain-containing histidine kinase [Bacteroidetes bacterium]|nr:HAMP domain-containing histidine kinase [Bacteroidota bacterium]